MHKKRGVWGTRIWVCFLLSLFFYPQISYVTQLGAGQFSILRQVRSIDEILASDAESDSLKQKLVLVEDIYAFGTKELGLSDEGAYSTFYDQKGKPVLWVLTVCAPFSLTPETWTFPIAGEVSYKGFFQKNQALEEMGRWKKNGYDVELEEVYAWSTLGWFKDPVMSQMLEKHPGDIANTIFHEMTHATIYRPGDIEFNENIATFIGDKACEDYLKKTYGESSEWLLSYRKSRERKKRYAAMVARQGRQLDSLYKAISFSSLQEKKRIKEQFMRNAVAELNTFRKFPLKAEDLTNCYYVDFKRYRSKQGDFDTLFEKDFSNHLAPFIRSFSKKR